VVPDIASLLARSSELSGCSDSPRLDTELLLCHVLGKPRTYLYTWPEYRLLSAEVAGFNTLFARRVQGEPIAYLIGRREFWSLSLKVSEATLIPRPETELLVELALALPLGDAASVADLGTGTGAVALALASERPLWQISAVEVCPEALALAEHNRLALGFDNVRVFQSDWFSALAGSRFDLVVSNPPYIDEADTHLQQGDVRFEPTSALVATDGGFGDLAVIIQHAGEHLNAGGWLLLEHGWQQGERVRQLMNRAGFLAVTSHSDLAGRERVTIGCSP
jgi:release factor glutamine methyltransferase